MTTVVLLVLALIWGVLLLSWLRSRSAAGFSDPVVTFRHHLNVLEKTTPTVVRPANRLAGPARRQPAPLAGRPTPGRMSRPLASNSAALRRRQTQKRRRDVFFVLLAGTVGSLALAMLPGLSIMWSVQVLFDIVFVAYVAILVNLRNRAAEREMKLRYMPPARTAVVARRGGYDFGAAGYGELDLRRVAN
ncbi:MAG: hypothetical protein KGQ66_13305 [Acidobacteriota bacterium]|nr:hypothetical protein [Acidobacteriota bacterium]